MSIDCPLLKPACKRNVVTGNKPYEKPKCPLTGLVPKCPLATPPCPLSPPKCPLIPDPCPLACPPPSCPLTSPPPRCPFTCPLVCPPCPPPPCPLACPPKCPLTPPACPLDPPKCPLTPPTCPLSPPKCPLTPPTCPLTPPKCPLAPPTCPLPPPACPLSPPKCPLAPPTCPLTPPTCPLSPPTCPLSPPACPLSPPKCPLTPPTCPLTPPKCPLAPPKCPSKPDPCPLSQPPKPQCPLLPPKCPLKPTPCPLAPQPGCDVCPLNYATMPSPGNDPCAHSQFLNKSVTRKPLAFPLPPSVCHQIARECPFEPKPMVCHEMCPCSEIPEIDAGPRCPFLPPEPVCPPICPLERQSDCPLIQKPRCMWKPMPPTQCPLTPSPQECPEPNQCSLQSKDVCPSFLPMPGKPKKAPPKPATSNIMECPFCEKKNESNYQATRKPPSEPNTFHFPSCPMFKASIQLQSLPTNKPVCPFYPCPCPLAGCGDCPIKVPALQTNADNQSARTCSSQSFSGSCGNLNSPSSGSSSLNCPPPCPPATCPPPCPPATCPPPCPLACPPPQCPLACPPPQCPLACPPPQCPLACPPPPCPLTCPPPCPPPFPSPPCPLACPPPPKCPLADIINPPKPLPPCPVKGCLKKTSSKNSGDCPVKTDSCALFPEGRCPMEDLGLCDCNYPVPPCLADNANKKDLAPAQYCAKDNCCMGLPDPPVIPAPRSSDTSDAFYSFMALNPENQYTKYYVDISNEPPEDLDPFSASAHKTPLRPQCSVIKFGEGFKECKTVKAILDKRGPCTDTSSQYDIKDCPTDNMAKMIQRSKNKSKCKN